MPEPDDVFWWFTGPSVHHLTEKLTAAGPDARLEIRLRQDKLYLTVVDPAGHGYDPIDDSHLCPPSCP
jgi:hypothetical protein